MRKIVKIDLVVCLIVMLVLSLASSLYVIHLQNELIDIQQERIDHYFDKLISHD